MLIGYPAPAVTDIDLTNGNWLTAGDGQQLIDGLPARIARFEQETGDPQIALTFAASFIPRVIALLGLSCAPGTAITATTGAGTALGGNAATGAAVRLSDGSVAAWILTSGSVETSSVKITIYATGTIDIGELVVMPAVDVAHEQNWACVPVDPSTIARTRGSQVAETVRRAYRQLRFALVPAGIDEARAGGLAAGLDWDQLVARLVGARRMVAIPRWWAGVAVDVGELHRTALYGMATPGGISHLGGNQYGSESGWTVDEIPPR